MEIKNVQEPLLMAVLFFIVSNDWFDNWLKDVFPQMGGNNPMMYTLIKTAAFVALYYLSKIMIDKISTKTNTSTTTTSTT